MSGFSLSTCHSDTDCSGAGRCVQDGQNGLFYCDCVVGYIDRHCRNRDPCLLEGNAKCQNGSTCKRISNYEYECKCRIPYNGKFCEMYNLCHVDVQECIGDLNTENPLDPICYPCVSGATCTQVSKRYYTCSCEAGFNHSSCFAYVTTPTPRQRSKWTNFKFENKSENKDAWSPTIPTIVIASLCLYFLLLFVALTLLRKRRRYRPKLTVCCDLHKFDDLTYYLISVETGSQWTAGIKGNIYCFLCGENGQAGPFPLNDLNLSDIYALQRSQEDNYLFSHSTDLGRIDKIVFWYSNQPQESTWFCEKITVRNVKTDENWHFYISEWFNSRKRKNYEFLAATSDFVQKQSTVRINYRHFCYQVARHHTYICPWIFATPASITLMFAEWMSSMLILTALYGFHSDKDTDYVDVYHFTDNVSKNGSCAAICCLCFGITCQLFFMICPRVTRIPTLIVWYDKPDMPEYKNVNVDIKKFPIRPPPPPITRNLEEKLKTPYYLNNQAIIQLENRKIIEKMKNGRTEKRMVLQNESAIRQNLCRILSSDLVKQKWVELLTQSSNSHERLAHGRLSPDRIKATTQDGVNVSWNSIKSQNTKLRTTSEKRKDVYCELCELKISPFWNSWGEISIMVGWIVCLCLIMASTVICCIYGEKYGYKRTYDWIISLAICWMENFFVLQFLKILLLVVIVTILINRKKLQSFETKKLKERFQVYYVRGLTVLPDKDVLKFVQYPPENWMPTPLEKLNYSSTNDSNTSIINFMHDA